MCYGTGSAAAAWLMEQRLLMNATAAGILERKMRDPIPHDISRSSSGQLFVSDVGSSSTGQPGAGEL